MKKIFLLIAVFAITGLAQAEEAKKIPEPAAAEEGPGFEPSDKHLKKLPYDFNHFLSDKGRAHKMKRLEKTQKELKDELSELSKELSELNSNNNRSPKDEARMADLRIEIADLDEDLFTVNEKIEELEEAQKTPAPKPQGEWNSKTSKKDYIKDKMFNRDKIFKNFEFDFGKKSPDYRACERYMKKQGVEVKGDFFVQMSRHGDGIRTFTDKGFTEFNSKREVCNFNNKPPIKLMPKAAGRGKFLLPFDHYNAFNKGSLVNSIFKGVSVPSIRNKSLIPGGKCIKLLLGIKPLPARDEDRPAVDQTPSPVRSGD